MSSLVGAGQFYSVCGCQASGSYATSDDVYIEDGGTGYINYGGLLLPPCEPEPTPTSTPTPSVTLGFVIEVNQQYEYTIGMLGNFSGGTAPEGATVPYSVMTSEDGDESIVQLNAISLGGFQGLNN